MSTPVEPGQEYVANHPLDNIRIRVESLSGNGTHAWVVDAISRKRPRKIKLASLHTDGKPRKSGYRLVTNADGSEA